ncbi:hypothetical protein J1N35_024507 [Gossypium stocksii]|uniref:Uncharacterized protein n=1 Tax=Gossypium stocksii TaxID=47602 RepID=A0A9D3V4T6_9ROSI|nr:hypothetical protein J1N35_024507 [Gossypium stocksii]
MLPKCQAAPADMKEKRFFQFGHLSQLNQQQQPQFKQLQTQMLPPLPKRTQAQAAQPLSVVRSSSGDGNATLQGGQFGLNTNQPESTRPTLCVALVEGDLIKSVSLGQTGSISFNHTNPPMD